MKHLSDIKDPFLRGYLLCAFWTEDDKAPSGEYGDSSRPDEMFTKLTKAGLRIARDDCALFVWKHKDLLDAACERDGYDMERAGHDFWLTRCRHGTGYWDRDALEDGDTPTLGRKLTAAAHAAGEGNLTSWRGWLYFA